MLLPALRDQPIRARVTRTSRAVNSRNRALRADIYLPNAKGEILPGMYAYGKVFVERPGVWALPVSTLHREAGKTFFWECNKGRAVRTEVRTGVSDGTWVEVTGKLVRTAGQSEGTWAAFDGTEAVIAGDLSEVSDGQPVTVDQGG